MRADLPHPHIPASFLGAVLAALALSSCVGIASDVELRADGSGNVAIEYRVSRLVESMGKLDEGERWLPLPIDRAGLERAVSQIGGLSLTSFSAQTDETDISVKTSLSFADIGALTRLIGFTGRTASISETGGKRSLTLRLSEGGGPLDQDLKRLVDTVFKGYAISLRFRLPAVPAVQGGGSVESATRSAVYSSPVADILSTEKPIAWIITW